MSVSQLCGQCTLNVAETHLICFQTHAVSVGASMGVLVVLDDNEETGWKYIHGDVFRFPPHKNVFCAFVGTGAQVKAFCTFDLDVFAKALIS